MCFAYAELMCFFFISFPAIFAASLSLHMHKAHTFSCQSVVYVSLTVCFPFLCFLSSSSYFALSFARFLVSKRSANTQFTVFILFVFHCFLFYY